MRSLDTFKKKMLKNPAVKEEYDAQEEEFALINELLAARAKAKLSLAQVAQRMGTSQSAVARMEGGHTPSLSSLRKYARALGRRVLNGCLRRRIAHCNARTVA